ncbi:MAG TPA: hypothetical protein VGT05_03315 [Patescibacteria group bacterium]|nr:hypothetical protein [Patescibacteria group bacterium]
MDFYKVCQRERSIFQENIVSFPASILYYLRRVPGSQERLGKNRSMLRHFEVPGNKSHV